MILSKDDLIEVMDELSKKRALFHSEADFQHSLALEIKERISGVELRLEKWGELINKNNNSVYTDIVLIDKNKRIILAIELKYKTFTVPNKGRKVELQNEEYFLKKQGAEDLCRYDFLKDIKRLELFNKKYNCSNSFAIVLTNDKHYWDPKYGIGGFSEEFLIYNQRTIKKNTKLNWIEVKNNGKIISKGTKKGRENPIELSNSYVLEWNDYKKVEVLPEKECLFSVR